MEAASELAPNPPTTRPATAPGVGLKNATVLSRTQKHRSEEATFSLCSFGWVEALTRAGRLDEARLAFEKMLTYANHVGLYSEEIGPTGEQLGNFPQAFTHLALISAAYNLDRQHR
jgi:GH15 family glucan-1,4-alpha-glucosidase